MTGWELLGLSGLIVGGVAAGIIALGCVQLIVLGAWSLWRDLSRARLVAERERRRRELRAAEQEAARSRPVGCSVVVELEDARRSRRVAGDR